MSIYFGYNLIFTQCKQLPAKQMMNYHFIGNDKNLHLNSTWLSGMQRIGVGRPTNYIQKKNIHTSYTVSEVLAFCDCLDHIAPYLHTLKLCLSAYNVLRTNRPKFQPILLLNMIFPTVISKIE